MSLVFLEQDMYVNVFWMSVMELSPQIVASDRGAENGKKILENVLGYLARASGHCGVAEKNAPRRVGVGESLPTENRESASPPSFSR